MSEVHGITAPVVGRYRIAGDGGPGTFAADVTYGVGTGPVAITTGDFEEDGDLAATNTGDDALPVLPNP